MYYCTLCIRIECIFHILVCLHDVCSVVAVTLSVMLGGFFKTNYLLLSNKLSQLSLLLFVG